MCSYRLCVHVCGRTEVGAACGGPGRNEPRAVPCWRPTRCCLQMHNQHGDLVFANMYEIISRALLCSLHAVFVVCVPGDKLQCMSCVVLAHVAFGQGAKHGTVMSGLAKSHQGYERVADEPQGFAYFSPFSNRSGVGETPKEGRRRNASLLPPRAV